MSLRTRIGITIGPSTCNPDTLTALFGFGVNFARINFSHGTHTIHTQEIALLRSVAHARGQTVAIMQDLTGPRIRIGIMPLLGFTVSSRETVIFNTMRTDFHDGEIPIDYSDLHEHVKIGDRMLIDDGRVEARITGLQGKKLVTEILEGGIIMTNKGINFPDSVLAIPILREKDREDIRFGVQHGVDMIALSFVKNAQDIIDAERYIRQIFLAEGHRGAHMPQIIAKIEHQEAVRNSKEIVEVSDGIMVARGDLGLEIPQAEVPLVQKQLILAAHNAGKPAMVATQLLDSMQRNHRPTRAELCDVANAVLDEADALILTNETAVGAHPVLAVKTLSEIITTTERYHHRTVTVPLSVS